MGSPDIHFSSLIQKIDILIIFELPVRFILEIRIVFSSSQDSSDRSASDCRSGGHGFESRLCQVIFFFLSKEVENL